VSGWFARFRRGRPAALTCYLRENGPIAYALDIFNRSPRERATTMLAADLAWYWRNLSAEGDSHDWTRVTAWSLAALLQDLAIAPTGITPRVLLIAIDPRDAPPAMSDAEASRSVAAFAGGADQPLHVLVSRPAPGGDLLFVAQQPPGPVRVLLQAWGIDRDKAERRAYARLEAHALERLPPKMTGDGEFGRK
jgi:hypothetical protein